MLTNDELKLLSDIDIAFTNKVPKWIEAFRKKTLTRTRLPFVLVYNAVGVSKTKNKSAAIAISTSNLQRYGILLVGTNSLSERGDLREIALLKTLGHKAAQQYLTMFESL